MILALSIFGLLAAVGVFAWTSDLFDGGAVSSWSGATTVNAFLDGRIPMGDLTKRLGEYDEVGTYGNNREWVRYRPAEKSIETVTAWLDAERVARWIRIEPARPAPLDAILASLRGLEQVVSVTPGNRFGDSSGPPGRLYSGGTAYAYAVSDDVEEIWLIPIVVNLADVVEAVRPAPPRALDVSGAGSDPRRPR